ncbi:peptide-N4-(N-acetyl-beta- glucosaminyl)asparagine amidase [Rhizophlyctis rosea]|uniref:Peptide-N4-(N-acetyl-beta-glucosaminyl)asparagine amidase n=1 Tax=Rhizophlyctis rosea TaxID=64517 RepID=A0AAD5SGV9_9FUNG|nr:peptide-N4-(N-acetyl-beta- glucosaminyl)asparagine amidase [Rhizophlyctis rosea]
MFTLKQLTTTARSVLPQSVRREMEERDRAEAEDLKNAPSRAPSQGEMSGRQSGSLEWRAARGEIHGDMARSAEGVNDLEVRIQKGRPLFESAAVDAEMTFVGSATKAHISTTAISSPSIPSIRITPAAPDQLGAAYVSRKVNLQRPFVIEFGFVITDSAGGPPQEGADGFAFVIQAHEQLALGWAASGGSGLGYEGIKKCLAVEFDCYESGKNADPNGNHISVQTRGQEPNSAHHRHSLGVTSRIPHIANGNIHFCQIVVDSSKQRIIVYLTDTWEAEGTGLKAKHYEKVLEVEKVEVGRRIGAEEAWIGFTAATGGLYQCHQVFGVKLLEFDVGSVKAGIEADVGSCV